MQYNKILPNLRGLTLVVAAIAWMAGILLNSWLLLPPFVFIVGTLLALIFVILLWRDNEARLIMLIILCILLGAWRYAAASLINDPQAISAFIGAGKLEVLGTVADEPKLGEHSRSLVIAVSAVSRNAGTSWQTADGQMEVIIPGSFIDNPYGPNYGDSVDLQGKLQAASPGSSPDIFASMAFPQVSITGSGGNPILVFFYSLRSRLATILNQSLPQPEAALLVAILLGLRTPSLLPLIPFFNETGTAHLIAPSGFKVTLLAGLVIASTSWLYENRKPPGKLLPAQKRKTERRRWVAISLVILSIAIYTLLNGAGPAALRAGIMGILVVLAPRLGRTYNVYTALAFAALVISLLDPFALWDVGFQLSFLGTLGIVVLTPFYSRLFHPLAWLPFGHTLIEIVAVTLAATTATLPIFALNFNSSISLIALVANVLTVPLLAILIFLGIVVSGAGLLVAQLGIVCGWVAWPLLWYVINIITFCSKIPGAYLNVPNLGSGAAWCYYVLLGFSRAFVMYRWPTSRELHLNPGPQGINRHLPPISKRTWRLLQLAAALCVILAVGATALAAQPDGQLTITFLNVGPPSQASQGEAIFVRTPDGKTLLIDGGLDATSLAQQLDSRLPFWQRTLDAVMLTSPKSDHLTGLQDIVNRYSIGEILDAGMLHPNTSYALWRRTISERNLHYVQVRQGASIAIGSKVMLQILWPTSPLHKSSTEELDNALILRLVAPGLQVLFLGAAALSKYALSGLLTNNAQDDLRATIVQVVGEAGKAFPGELRSVLQRVQPSALIITPAALSAKLRKAGVPTVIPSSSILTLGPEQVAQTAQAGTLQVNANESGWSISAG